jgi:hypothetical protein
MVALLTRVAVKCTAAILNYVRVAQAVRAQFESSDTIPTFLALHATEFFTTEKTVLFAWA